MIMLLFACWGAIAIAISSNKTTRKVNAISAWRIIANSIRFNRRAIAIDAWKPTILHRSNLLQPNELISPMSFLQMLWQIIYSRKLIFERVSSCG